MNITEVSNYKEVNEFVKLYISSGDIQSYIESVIKSKYPDFEISDYSENVSESTNSFLGIEVSIIKSTGIKQLTNGNSND